MNFSLDCLNSFWDRNIVISLVLGCVLVFKHLWRLNAPKSFNKDLQDKSVR